MWKLKTSAEETDYWSTGFDRDRNRRKQELTNNKNNNGTFYVRIMLKDALDIVEYQEETSYGLGYKLTLTRNKDDAVMHKPGAIAHTIIKNESIHWYKPHYTHSISQRGSLSQQILSKTHTELR